MPSVARKAKVKRMKLRRLPEDFQVEELGDLRLGEGRFAIYRLTKRSRGTLEAIASVAKHLRLPRQVIGYGGLKDRHALTRQFVSIAGGPSQSLALPGIELDYLGQSPEPFDASRNLGNRFAIVVRRLREPVAASAAAGLPLAEQFGVPNYFDDQRFGSLGSSGEFMARAWCLGDCQRALRLALTDPNPHDSAAQLAEKERLDRSWGDWAPLARELKDRTARQAASWLAEHPDDYRRAMAVLPVELRGLYLSSFQSALWNAMADVAVRRHARPEQIVRLATADRPLAFYRQLDAESAGALAVLSLPLPAARTDVPPGPAADLLRQVLAAHGLEQRQLRVKYPRDSFFARGWRSAAFRPANSSAEVSDDELYPGYRKLELKFDLPKSSYATMVIKRLFIDFPAEHTSRTGQRRKRQRRRIKER